MEDKPTPIEVLLERAQAYTKTSIQLFKLKATDKLAEMISNLSSGFTIFVFFILFFVNLNIGIALLIGSWLDSTWLGFVLISGVYACIGLIVYRFRESLIKKPVRDSIIEQLLNEDQLKEDQIPE